jgi:hypothetical protein
MQNAPPVVYPVGHFFALRWLLLTLLLLSALWLWRPYLADRPHNSVQFWGTVAIQFFLVWVTWRSLRQGKPVVRNLSWNGKGWTCERDDGLQSLPRVEVQLDGQRWLWLCLHPRPQDQGVVWGCGRRWVLARRSANPAAWHGFRCAVYCRHQSELDLAQANHRQEGAASA